MENFICERCGNSDPKYIGMRNGKPYCRVCVSMNGEKAGVGKINRGSVILKLNYPLSKDQKEISDKLIENYKNKKDTLVNAVCGAGKTELVYHLIANCLANGKKVAFAVPRRDVVIELYMRIREVFPYNRVVSVYGSHTSSLTGDIVVLTTHQLYRYEKYFDLIILDEIDAFPFKNNPLLNAMFERAKKGNIVLMSATPSIEVLEYFSCENHSILELNTRFHKHPLPVPQVVVKVGYFKFFFLIRKIHEFLGQKKKVFIFTPTIERCEFVYKIIKNHVKGGYFVHSKCKNRETIIKDFKDNKYKFLVTTAVLERGVTVKDLQVIIFDADHKLYDEQALVQISGRVGRKIDAPEGEVIFLVNKRTTEIEKAIRTIESKNKNL